MLLFVIIVLFGIIASARPEMQPSDVEFLKKQELIFQLLWHTKDVPKNHPEVFERIKNYKLEDVAAACENQTHAKDFELYLTHHSPLPRGEIFSWYRDEHVKDIRNIYTVLRNARNFDEFAALSAWSSLHVNELAWLHAFAAALAHRPDCKNLRLPNLHEIVPEYFFNADVVVLGYRARAGEIAGVSDQYTIEANYTADEPTQDTYSAESRLSYFLEDVGLNEFYFHKTIDSPFWLPSDEPSSKNLRGEAYCHLHRWLLARYKLERLSLGLGEIEDIDWEQPIATGFRPSMIHENGLLFPSREPNARVPPYKYGYLEETKHYEHRISKATDLGELRTTDSRIKKLYDDSNPTAFTDFCNAIEGNADSPNGKLYGSLDRLYRRLMGFAPETRRPVPSAVEMPMTSLRDPGFFRVVKRIVELARKFKENLPSYKREDLNFDGVRVDYIHVDRLTTYFDRFESTLNHPRILRLDDRPSLSPVVTIKVKQTRLDHKPFNFEIGASSEKSTKAVVRVFVGPKVDVRGREVRLEESFEDYYEIDRWIVELKPGINHLTRNSADSIHTSPEPLPSDVFNRQLNRAFRTSDENLMRDSLSRCRARRGVPLRLLLPRGNKAGLPVRFLVCLNAVEGRISEEDGRPMGFPLDRKPGVELPRNCMVKDVRVYHEDVGDVEKDN